jgi:RND superfamily putative drug exporter
VSAPTDAVAKPRGWIRLLPVGRVSKWVSLIGWLVVIGATSGLAGRIWTITEENATTWLPRTAESTEVVQLQEAFADGNAPQVVVVYHRSGGLTDADRRRAEGDVSDLATDEMAEPGVSADGTTLWYSVPLTGDLTVPQVRTTVGGAADGLDVKVTGAAAFQYDLDDTFQALDVTLLLVTVGIVALLLLITYRSLVLWLLPLLVVALANQLADAVVFVLADRTGMEVNSAAIFVITVLVYGVGTDYALLLISRYRDELRRHADRHQAMRAALLGAGPAIVASAATVTLGMLCMMAADLNSTRTLGPAAAVGVVCAFAAMVTLLPALLVIFGRWVFWPLIPRTGQPAPAGRRLWDRVGAGIARRPRLIWLASVVALAALTLGLLGTAVGLPQDKAFRGNPDSVAGQRLLAAVFPPGTGQPATVVADTDQINAVVTAARGVDGVAEVSIAGRAGALSRAQVTVDAAPGSAAERDIIERLREAVHAVPGADARVGGPGAQALDLTTTTGRDERMVMPLILVVVLLVLIVLLRALIGPILLVATVVLSFAAAMGISGWLCTQVLGMGGIDASLALAAFAFLVAVGVDYNIFLVSRVRQETATLGTRAGTLAGLSSTGGVITSAGVVLAGTFAALIVLPATATIQLGLTVAIGVLLDTLFVRSVLVPALLLDTGRWFWWPSRLDRRPVTPLATPLPSGVVSGQ